MAEPRQLSPLGEKLKGIARALEQARIYVGQKIDPRLADYSSEMFWDNSYPRNEFRVRSVKDSDLASIKFMKHCLWVLQDAERLAKMAQEFAELSSTKKIYHLPATYKKAYGVWSESLSKHINAISKMIDHAEVPESMKVNFAMIKNQLLSLPQSLPGGTGGKAINLNEFEGIGKGLVDLIQMFPQVQRASAPKLVGSAYIRPEEKVHYEDELPIREDLRPIFRAALEPARVVTPVVRTMLDEFCKAVDNKREAGVVINKKSEDYIKKTVAALKNPMIIDEKGYCRINDDASETDISKLLKSTLNLVLRANELVDTTGIIDMSSIVWKAKDDLAHILEFKRKLAVMALNKELGAAFELPIQMLLLNTKNILFPNLAAITEAAHQFERQNGLKHGSTLAELRMQFRAVEELYLTYGVVISNPFGEVESVTAREKANALRDEIRKNNFVNNNSQKDVLHYGILLIQNYPKSKLTEKDFTEEFSRFKKVLNPRDNPELKADLEALEKQLIQRKPSQKLLDKIVQLATQREQALSKAILNEMKFGEYKKQEKLEETDEAKRINREFFVETLKSGGINALIQPIKVAQESKYERDNLAAKRVLAALQADFAQKPRIEYLANAHQKAVEFVQDPEIIKKWVIELFSGRMGSENILLGHELALEATLSGFVNPNDWHSSIDWVNELLSTDDSEQSKRDLINALTRLESVQIFELMKNAKAGDANAIRRLQLLNNLILPGKGLRPLTEKEWVDLLVARYEKESDLEIKKVIGLFLGRIALEDKSRLKDYAKAIYPDHKAIVYAESLDKDKHIASSLYYEGMINSMSLMKEIPSFAAYLDSNKNLILAMSKEVMGMPGESDAGILQYYKDNPLVLAKLVESFNKLFISPDSQAEMHLQEFYAVILAHESKESKIIRDELFVNFQKMEGSTWAPLAIMVPEKHSAVIWGRIAKDVVANEASKVPAEIDKAVIAFKSTISDLPMDKQKSFNEAIDKLVADKKEELNDYILDQGRKISSHATPVQARFIQQEINSKKLKINQEINKKIMGLTEKLTGLVEKKSLEDLYSAQITSLVKTTKDAANSEVKAVSQMVTPLLAKIPEAEQKEVMEKLQKLASVQALDETAKSIKKSQGGYKELEKDIEDTKKRTSKKTKEVFEIMIKGYVKKLEEDLNKERHSLKQSVREDKKTSKKSRDDKLDKLSDFKKKLGVGLLNTSDLEVAAKKLSVSKAEELNLAMETLDKEADKLKQEMQKIVTASEPPATKLGGGFFNKKKDTVAANDPKKPQVPKVGKG